MRKVVIDRNIWIRGEGSLTSKLLRQDDGKMCCVGIYLSQTGVEANKLLGISDYEDLLNHVIKSSLPQETHWLEGHRYLGGRDVLTCLYIVNDSTDLTEEQRESKLKELFRQRGVEVEFTN